MSVNTRFIDTLAIGTALAATALSVSGALPVWAVVAALPVGVVIVAKAHRTAELDRLRSVHKAYTLRQMMLTERRRVW
ncbi:MAG: hypothetical protein U0746_14335 [Gemmataceae bacterium]